MNRADSIKTQVKGFLEPVFIGQGPDGRKLNGLAKPDFERVRAGFACADCLAAFDTYTITCPICGLSRNVTNDIQQAPEVWQQHINERNAPWEAVDKPKPFNPLEAIEAVKNDRDVDQIPLSKITHKHRPKAKA